MEYIIHIKDGEITNKTVIRNAVKELHGRYLVKITKSNKRSLNQNAYIQQWASEFLGVQIPDPNEQVELFN